MAHELVDDLKKGGALITLDDLAQYNVVERKPVIGTFHNYTIISAPPPSSGGVVLLSALNILEGYDLAQPRRPHRRLDAPDHRGLSTRLHGSRRLPRRSRLQPDSRRRTHREEVRRSMAQEHPARQSQSQRRPEASRRLSATRADHRRHSATNRPTRRTTPSSTPREMRSR